MLRNQAECLGLPCVISFHSSEFDQTLGVVPSLLFRAGEERAHQGSRATPLSVTVAART